MAIENSQIDEILNSEDEQSKKIESIQQLYADDFTSQLNAILATKEDIKREKTEEIAKRHAVEKERDGLKESVERLEKQMKDLAPEELQKGFEQRLQESANHYQSQLMELQQERDGYKTKLAEAERATIKVECMQEFNKAISGKKIASDMIDAFSTFVLGPDCSYFDRRPIGNGQTILATKDGQSVKQAVESGCLTTFGKNCLENTSSGGGAEGGSTGKLGGKENPFITGNKTEQALLKIRDPQLYEVLRKQAGR